MGKRDDDEMHEQISNSFAHNRKKEEKGNLILSLLGPSEKSPDPVCYLPTNDA